MRLGPTKTIELSLGLSMGLKGSDLISWHQTSRDKLRTQKSPQSFHLAGFQDFCGRLWNRREKILVELAGVEPASGITTPSALHA